MQLKVRCIFGFISKECLDERYGEICRISIFACKSNPEIKPELVDEVESNAIVTLGRSDYHNQVNNLIKVSAHISWPLDVEQKK